MRVVLDTNVIISGMINTNGTPAQIVNLFMSGRITILYDSRILKEYEEVLSRKKFGFNKSVLAPILDRMRNEGEYVVAEPLNIEFADEDDKMFYEVARTAKAKCIVTGNKEHFPNEGIVKSPKEFIAWYLSEHKDQRAEAT
jgi:putative PIN family toxin of toxin-antitoxin system